MSAPKLIEVHGASPELRLAPAKGEAPRDSICSWLDVLVKLLRLPEAERAAVREELEAHLSERVRDLMVTGLSEVEASGRAIAELGDMAGLAQRFNRAARPVARRRLMNLGMLAVAGAGLIAGVAALTGPREDRVAVAVFAPEVTKEAAQAAGGKFDVPPDASWARFYEAAGQGLGLPVVVNWGQLAAIAGSGALGPNERATVTGSGLTLPEALAMVNEGLASADDGIDYRVHDGRLEIATVAYFDRRETVLATYDLAGIVEARLHDADPTARQVVTQQVSEQVAILIRDLVHPNLWRDNGGDRASLAVFGTKLFVTAPKRMHPKIRWVLSELPSADGEAMPQAAISTASIERRQRAAMLRLQAVRQEASQMASMRDKGFMSSTEVARRSAELAEEEAELLDRITALEAQRAAITGGPRVEGGSIGPDGVVVDEQGRPAAGAELRMEPRLKVSPREGGQSALDTAVFRPERMGPAAMRDVLSAALNIVPELKQAPMRVLEVDESDGILKVTAPVDQLEKIGRIVRALDLPGPAERGGQLVTTTIVLQSERAVTAMEMLALAYSSRPGMQPRFAGHSVAVDGQRNALIVTSRPGQVEFIEGFIAALDGR
ncbi:MAG: hypothetical protein IT436_12020 [Phycisphaerales bacterium]|nr:hypothetical protein [Phycisphaerales bacterium]